MLRENLSHDIRSHIFYLTSAHRPDAPQQQTEVCPSELFMPSLVSHEDKQPEIIFESCLNPVWLRRGMTARARWIQSARVGNGGRSRTEKKIRAIHQSHPSDNSAARLHFLPPI